MAIPCPLCLSRQTRYHWGHPGKSKGGDPYTRRKRVCARCGHSFLTYECYEVADCEAAMKGNDALESIEHAADTLRSIGE